MLPQLAWRFAAATVCMFAAALYIAEGVDLIRDGKEKQFNEEVTKMSEGAVWDGRSSSQGSYERSSETDRPGSL
jgi:hypothetical protein